MSNLRSDCLEIADKQPSTMIAAHIRCLCSQIDEVEEYWHTAERKLQEARAALVNWSWMAEMGCWVSKDSDINAKHLWVVLDVDSEIIARGDTPEDAIANAKKSCEKRWAERVKVIGAIASST